MERKKETKSVKDNESNVRVEDRNWIRGETIESILRGSFFFFLQYLTTTHTHTYIYKQSARSCLLNPRQKSL